MSTKFKGKPSLKIQINQDDNEQSKTVRYYIPVVKSAKNNHELKKFNFTQVLPSQLSEKIEKIEKQEKIKKLEKEKAQLMESLEILKNGAVNAIVEKQQIISKLRKLFSQKYPHQSQDRDDPKLQQLQNLLAIIKDLQQDRNILRQEVQIQKQNFYLQIQQRQAIIQQLTNQLNWSTQRIDNLEKYDKLLEQKIKVMQQSNQNLSILLNQSQQNLKDERRKHSEQSILFKNKSNSSIHHGSDSENGSFWNVKPARKRSSNYNLDELAISMSKSLDQSIFQSKIQQIKNQHQLQIQDLTHFYQTRIQTLKILCEPYTDHPLTNFSAKSKQLNETNVVTQVVDNNSNCSGFTNDVKEQQKILRKKLSLGSFKSGGGLKMDTIDQRQEIQSPRRSLRRQIQSFYKHNNNNSQAQISKNNANQSVDNQSDSSKSSNLQKQSQFSYKYFQYPTSNFKKNKTQQGQLNHLKQQTSSMRKILQIPVFQINRIPIRKQSQAQIQQRKKVQSKQFWQKFIWFASGTITGGILLNLGNKLFK